MDYFGILFPLIPLEILLSTKGLMFLLLSAYGGAMWTFLSGAPRVHTVIVPDLEEAKRFYESHLQLPEAELPLQYYYGYEQGMGSSLDAAYFPSDLAGRRYMSPPPPEAPGLWYQLSEGSQLHIIVGNTDPESTSSRYSSSRYTGASAPYEGFNPGRYGTASRSAGVRYRHTSFDREGVKALLKYLVKKGVSHSVRSEKPLVFWVRDAAGQIVEIAELAS
jgi:catechol 2,3-dioxygenase-like lactoylglutathione lyase family enzyme